MNNATQTTVVETVALRSGLVVVAKRYKGELVAKTYANRTQARRCQEQLGSAFDVYGLSVPFFVGVKRGDNAPIASALTVRA